MQNIPKVVGKIILYGGPAVLGAQVQKARCKAKEEEDMRKHGSRKSSSSGSSTPKIPDKKEEVGEIEYEPESFNLTDSKIQEHLVALGVDGADLNTRIEASQKKRKENAIKLGTAHDDAKNITPRKTAKLPEPPHEGSLPQQTHLFQSAPDPKAVFSELPQLEEQNPLELDENGQTDELRLDVALHAVEEVEDLPVPELQDPYLAFDTIQKPSTSEGQPMKVVALSGKNDSIPVRSHTVASSSSSSSDQPLDHKIALNIVNAIDGSLKSVFVDIRTILGDLASDVKALSVAVSDLRDATMNQQVETQNNKIAIENTNKSVQYLYRSIEGLASRWDKLDGTKVATSVKEGQKTYANQEDLFNSVKLDSTNKNIDTMVKYIDDNAKITQVEKEELRSMMTNKTRDNIIRVFQAHGITYSDVTVNELLAWDLSDKLVGRNLLKYYRNRKEIPLRTTQTVTTSKPYGSTTLSKYF